MRLGLRCRGRIAWHGGAKITDARHRNNSDALSRQPTRERHALVIPATSAVDHEQWHARAGLLVFDQAASGEGDQAASCCACPGQTHVLREVSPDREDHNQRCRHDQCRCGGRVDRQCKQGRLYASMITFSALVSAARLNVS